jgi:hypothetical protein
MAEPVHEKKKMGDDGKKYAYNTDAEKNMTNTSGVSISIHENDSLISLNEGKNGKTEPTVCT